MDRDSRDLAWCIQSNPLFRFQDDNQWPSPEWFASLPLPEDTFQFTPPNNYRLGLRFEALVQAWLQQTEPYELIAANLPIRDEKRTIGEFDLLVKLEETVEHWELAVKFYLGVGDTTDTNRFFGPNPVDTLETKLQRLREHQLQLSEFTAAKRLLKEKGIGVDQKRGLVKGRLFYPLNDWQSDSIRHPDCVDPGHHTGWWSELEGFAANMAKDHYFAVLPKPYWLARINPEDAIAAMDLSAFVALAAETKDGTLHVVELSASGMEVSRGFIVFPRWLRGL